MANTVNSLNYANTFADWVNVTNLMTIETNSLGKSTYTKDSGVMIFNGSGEAVRANGPVNIYNSLLSVIGTGSNTYIQNGLTVGGSAIIGGPTTVGGTLVANGSSYFNSNTFTIGANTVSAGIATINVGRGSSGANAIIRWNEANKYWDILDVVGGSYYRILTTNNQTITDSLTTTSGAGGSAIAASATAANNLNSLVFQVYAKANAASGGANSALNTINGTSGIAIPSSGSISFNSANGFQAVASGSTITFSDAQDLRQSANVTFAGATITGPVGLNSTTNFNALSNFNANVAFNGQVGYSIGWGAYGSNAGSKIYDNTQLHIWTDDSTYFDSFGSSNWYWSTGVTSNGASSTVVAQLDGSGNYTSRGNITAYGSPSDIRLKENLIKIPNALNSVQQLNGYTYNYIGQKDRLMGVVAQEVEKIAPELVYQFEDLETKELTKAVRYEHITALLIEAIKELKAEIDELKNK